MKSSKFTDERIIAIVREQEAGAHPGDICLRYGISESTFYRWKLKFGGLRVSEVKRLQALKEENARLRALLAEALNDILGLTGATAARKPRPGVRRETGAYVRKARGLNDRRVYDTSGIAGRIQRLELLQPD